MKTAYISPSQGTLSLMIKSLERPEALFTLDLSIPVWPVWTIRVPMDFDDGAVILDMALQAMCDDVLGFLLTMDFGEAEAQMVYAQILSAYEAIKTTDIKENNDGGSLLYEAVFPLDQDFINKTHEKIVTATKRTENAARPVKRMQVIQKVPRGQALPEAKAIIQKYRNRALKGQPRPMYLLVYDYNGRPMGVKRL